MSARMMKKVSTYFLVFSRSRELQEFFTTEINFSQRNFIRSRTSNIESGNSQNVGLEDYNNSRTSNIAFFWEWAQMSDLDFGLIRQNISNKKASFHYQGCPLSLKSGKLWLNSYIYWISITSNWFYSQQFSQPY